MNIKTLVSSFLRESVGKIRSIFRRPESRETYIGENTLFDSRQKTLERYGDFKQCGEWGIAHQISDGKWETVQTGPMMSETVKFTGQDGKVKLGSDWVAAEMPDQKYRDSADDGNDGPDDRFTAADWWKKS